MGVGAGEMLKMCGMRLRCQMHTFFSTFSYCARLMCSGHGFERVLLEKKTSRLRSGEQRIFLMGTGLPLMAPLSLPGPHRSMALRHRVANRDGKWQPRGLFQRMHPLDIFRPLVADNL
jgi:hypothetical protein